MLEITLKQMDILSRGQFEHFIHCLARSLAHDFPARCRTLSPNGLLGAVRELVQDARQYGIYGRSDIEFYVRLQAMLGRGFHLMPEYRWERQVLECASLQGNEKISRLHDRFVFTHKHG